MITRPTRFFGWLALVACVATGVWLWMSARAMPVRPAGFVLACDETSRVRHWLGTRAVGTVLTVPPGELVKVPGGARVRVVYGDGRVENVAGPAELTFGQVPDGAAGARVEDGAFLQPLLAELAALAPGGRQVTAGPIHITSPVGVTRFKVPMVAWQGRADTDYDVVVIDPADPAAPPRVAKKVRSPVSIAELVTPQKRRLNADRSYEVYVRESADEAVVGAARVFVAVDAKEEAMPTEPAELLMEAVSAMAKKPTRTGDAWIALSRLPVEWAEAELSVRLRLRVAAELGLVDEFARAQEAAWRLGRRVEGRK